MNAITNFKLLKTITSLLILIPVFYGCNSVEPNINDDTIDTTSHNFTWQTFTFGEHSSSTLYDVAIIDENNIWAVGEIYLNDSLGQPDPHPYGIIHWDGLNWYLMMDITSTNSEFQYSLSARKADQQTLGKNNYTSTTYQGNLPVIAYKLEQNFPNPFNPSTVINTRYQRTNLYQ